MNLSPQAYILAQMFYYSYALLSSGLKIDIVVMELYNSKYKMSTVQKLYELQETEVEIDSAQKTLAAYRNRLGESDILIAARAGLLSVRQMIEELKKKQRDLENEIDDIGAKLSRANEDLYSGRIKNPKELSNLQQEAKVMESQKGQLEDELLEIMSGAEVAAAEQTVAATELKAVEEEWRSEQQALKVDIEQLKNSIAELESKRQRMIDDIEPQAMEYYNRIKAQKGLAVAVIEQGMCRGCRISLSTAELQRVRVGHVVECSSCHRILYLP
jgi:predicted  nucleic acid-binding Zn-ribbon protein